MKLPQLSRTPRHTEEKEDDSLIITIKSRRNIPALLFMFAWLCGITYIMFATWLIWSVTSLGFMGWADPELKTSPIFGVPFCGFSIFLLNLSCDLPKEIDAASEYKESDLDFKTSGSDSMNGFW